MHTNVFATLCVAMTSIGCITPKFTPNHLTVPPSQADVIWVTRNVTVNESDHSYTVEGLFACYRQPVASPGEPTCYLARYRTKEGSVIAEDMEFPDRVRARSYRRPAKDAEDE